MPSPRPARPRATTLTQVAALVDGRLDPASTAIAGGAGVAVGAGETLVSGVTLSSQDVAVGDLYAALPGANAHGASFARDAVEHGAVAILTDERGAALLADSGLEVPRIVVPDPRSVVGAAASLVYATDTVGLQLVGVTGTNGKTTTAYLIDSALTALGRTTGLIGTVETRIGDERVKSVRTTPEATVLHALLAVMAERGVDTCVMEVSSHALSQHRVDGVVYDVALFTNLSQDHLDFHPTMRDYFEAKASLFTPARARTGVVCVDDEWGQELARTATIPVTTVSSVPGRQADWRIEDGPERHDVVLTNGVELLRLRSALPGDFNRVNTAMAALALVALGVTRGDAERALQADPHVPGRMERVILSGDQPSTDPPNTDLPNTDLPLVVVDYAHTPDAVAAALRALRPSTAGRLVVVLGAGGDRDRGKRAAMGDAAARHADLVFVTDDNPRSEDPAVIRAAVLAGARDARTDASLHEVAGRSAAIDAAIRAAAATGPGATVAIVGKGHETGQDVAGTVHPFDDRAEARRALESVAAERAAR